MIVFFLSLFLSLNIFSSTIGIDVKNKCSFLIDDIFKEYDDIEIEIPTKYTSNKNFEITGISFSNNHKIIFIDAIIKNKKIKIKGNVILLKKVPVLKSKIYKEKIIKESDLKEILINYEKIPANSLLDKNSIIGMVSSHSTIFPDRPINSNKIKPPLFVKRGDIAKVIYKRGLVHLELKAKALKDGRLGDLISFKNTNSGKTIYGTVISKGKAEV